MVAEVWTDVQFYCRSRNRASDNSDHAPLATVARKMSSSQVRVTSSELLTAVQAIHQRNQYEEYLAFKFEPSDQNVAPLELQIHSQTAPSTQGKYRKLHTDLAFTI